MFAAGRHSFNPNTVYMHELSPRTAITPDHGEFGSYVIMDDDTEVTSGEKKLGGLAVPTLDYNPSKGGLRSRSRSPLPDRKALS